MITSHSDIIFVENWLDGEDYPKSSNYLNDENIMKATFISLIKKEEKCY
tara:strand:- start:315 stop:461 length:147 start_codon:yes stop_codon:yes gene_type:complete